MSELRREIVPFRIVDQNIPRRGKVFQKSRGAVDVYRNGKTVMYVQPTGLDSCPG